MDSLSVLLYCLKGGKVKMSPAKLTSEFHVGEIHTGDEKEAEAILRGPW